MDLFAITCTTCKSRLRVRDSAAIGQILACPKCGGMVMVKPPPAWNEGGEQKSELPTAPDVEGPRERFDETAHGSAFDMLEELLSDAPPKVQSPAATNSSGAQQSASSVPPAVSQPANAPPAPPKPRFVGGPPVRRSSTPPPDASKSSVMPFSAGPIPPATKSAASQPVIAGASDKAQRSPAGEAKPPAPSPPAERNGSPPPAARQPAAAPQRKQWLLMGGSVAVGVLLAFTAVTAAIHYLRPANVGRPIAPRPPGKSSPPQIPSTAKSSSSQTTVAPEVAASTSESAIPTPPEATAEPAKPIVSASTLPTSPAAESDPLELVKTPPAAVATTTTSDPLAKFDRILGSGTDDPLGKSTTKPADTPPLPPPDAAPIKPLAPRPPPREVDVAKRLADPLPGIETSPPGTPLADFVQLMSDLSTIPITLDVPFVPATPESAVSLRLANTTVGNAITEALKPWRLEQVVVDDQLVVRRAEPSKPAPVTASVKNLTGPDEQSMTDLAELLKAIVAPGSWDEGDEAGTIAVNAANGSLVITHPRSVQFQVQVRLAIEKLREARKPPLTHELKLDPMFFKLDTRASLAKPRLENTVSLNYSQPTRLVTILERLGATAGLRILVDWHDVVSAGWNSAGEATLVVSNQPLSAALDALLTPLDLTWRIIDGQTIQVVTPPRLAEQGELEFYKVDDLVDGGTSAEALIAKLRTALGDSAFISGGGNGEIRYDDGGKCLLAWLPQPKQREAEALLAKWREVAK